MSSIVGTTISDRYRIERLLGEGGMGSVYEAEHTLMHKRVAIKVLHAEMSQLPEVVSRFEREALAASHIDHPNVAAATDFGKLEDGSFFLVLEFVEGKSLREILGGGAMSARRALHIARQIASALSRAHAAGIVHRDLKPENVMIVLRDDDPDFVKVLDFGIAKVPVETIAPKSQGGEVLTRAGMIYGTPEYMPPEQALGEEVDLRADIYALGVMTYEMLVGRRPFDDESRVKLLGMHINAPVPPMPAELQVPRDLELLVNKMLAKAASDRIQEARDLIEAFDAIDTSTPPPVAVMSGPHVAMTSQPSLPNLNLPSGPTVLAISTHAHSLTRDMTRIFPPKVIIAAAGVVGVLVLVTTLVLVFHTSSSKSSASAQASASADQQAATFDRDLAEAQADIAASKWDDAIVRARALETEDPSRAESYQILFRAHAARNETKLALADASSWLGADSNARTDSQLRDFVRQAAQSRDDEGSAFALLESGKLGPQGADMLYELAWGGGQSAATQAHARKSLTHETAVEHASAETRVAIELRNAKDCESKHALLERASLEGDARALAIIETYSTKNGCGFLGTRDCNPCLHKDDALTRALTKLRGRVNP